MKNLSSSTLLLLANFRGGCGIASAMQMMRLRSVVGDILSILEVERIPNPSLVREIMQGLMYF